LTPKEAIVDKDYQLNFLSNNDKIYIEIHEPLNGWQSLYAQKLLVQYSNSMDSAYKEKTKYYKKLYIPVFLWYESFGRKLKKLLLFEYDTTFDSNLNLITSRKNFIELE
jgi:hypothetical protein